MSENGSQNGHAIVKTKPQHVTLRRLKPREFDGRTPVKSVDYHANWKDYMCYALAALGRTNKAIAVALKLTEAQVQYRITKVERERGKGAATMRAQYRNGKGPIAQAVASVLAVRGSSVRKEITETLDKRGMYAPRIKGVLRNEAN